MSRKKGSKNKKESISKKEDTLKDYKEDKKKIGDSIFDEDEKLNLTTTEKLNEEPREIKKPKVQEFDEKYLLRHSKKLLDFTKGVQSMIDRSKGAGTHRDIPKILQHLKKMESMSGSNTVIDGYIKTLREKANVCKAINVKKERIPVFLEMQKIVDDLIDEIKPYERRG